MAKNLSTNRHKWYTSAMGLFDDLMGSFNELADELKAPLQEVIEDVRGSVQDAVEIKDDVTNSMRSKVKNTQQQFVDGVKKSVTIKSDDQ